MLSILWLTKARVGADCIFRTKKFSLSFVMAMATSQFGQITSLFCRICNCSHPCGTVRAVLVTNALKRIKIVVRVLFKPLQDIKFSRPITDSSTMRFGNTISLPGVHWAVRKSIFRCHGNIGKYHNVINNKRGRNITLFSREKILSTSTVSSDPISNVSVCSSYIESCEEKTVS